MNIRIMQKPSVKETEVNILCKEENSEIRDLYAHIKQFSTGIICYQEKKQMVIPVYQILYLESIDGKTFIYTSEETYQYKESLKNVEEGFNKNNFIRISKSIMINLKQLKYVEPFENHRLLVTMKNGEQLLTARTYISRLKERIIQL